MKTFLSADSLFKLQTKNGFKSNIERGVRPLDARVESEQVLENGFSYIANKKGLAGTKALFSNPQFSLDLKKAGGVQQEARIPKLLKHVFGITALAGIGMIGLSLIPGFDWLFDFGLAAAVLGGGLGVLTLGGHK